MNVFFLLANSAVSAWCLVDFAHGHKTSDLVLGVVCAAGALVALMGMAKE